MYAAYACCASFSIFGWRLQGVEDHEWLVLCFLLSSTSLLLETLTRRRCGCGCGVFLASRTHSCCQTNQTIRRGFTGNGKIFLVLCFRLFCQTCQVLTSGAVLQKVICPSLSSTRLVLKLSEVALSYPVWVWAKMV